jgi:hypothetical protein
MAKKTAKKSPSRPAAKASKKTAKKTAKKPGGKPAGKSAGGSSSLAPVRVGTGSGATPEQIGRSLVELFNAGKAEQVETKWWSPQIESVEGMGMAWKGRAAADAKNREWMNKNRIHGASAEGPFVGATGFAVKFRMDVEELETGKRTLMEEVGVYTVMGGKIVREEFMYGSAKATFSGSGGGLGAAAGPAAGHHSGSGI